MTKHPQNWAVVTGCGPSSGVPFMSERGPVWGKCDPNNPRNHRSRSGLYVHFNHQRFLIDVSPDFRQQALRHCINRIDHILLTHAHADHIMGMDDLKSFFFYSKKPLSLWGSTSTLETVKSTFPYLCHSQNDLYPAILNPCIIEPGTHTFGQADVVVFKQDHGLCESYGFRFGDMAYSTDFVGLDDAAIDLLQGVKVWFIDCTDRNKKPTHCHLEASLAWIKRVNPEKAFLIHMNATLDYEALCHELPESVRPAYDGLKITF